jgi:serine protease Do
MNIEQLTKAQIILLTLLVSFVTSIATGIFTVTLLDQAPPAVTQTINKVVERTIETVIPDDRLRAGVVTEEVTVVVREDDLITESIEDNMRSLVTIYRDIVNEEGQSVSVAVGSGVIMTRDGIIATDSSVIRDGAEYQIVTEDGTEHIASVLAQDEEASVALLSVKGDVTDDGEETLFSFPPVTFSRGSSLKLGQTVIALSISQDVKVATGVIAGLRREDIAVDVEEGEKPRTKNTLVAIETSISGSADVGSPIISIFGEVLGMNLTGTRDNAGRYLPIDNVLSLLGSLSAEPQNQG